jgi:hypothetical protein
MNRSDFSFRLLHSISTIIAILHADEDGLGLPEQNSSHRNYRPLGAKAPAGWKAFTARLKSCPFATASN